MTIRNIFSIILATIFPVGIYAYTDIRPIEKNYSEYNSYALANKIDDLTPLLVGETIRFSNFNPNKDIVMFEYEVPDTIWLKERPKKNPKEGKHYVLRHKYHSVIKEESVYSKSTKEVTPAIELTGSQFLVTNVENVGGNSYHTRTYFNVHITNTTTDERIIWYIRPGSTSYDNEYIVHLTGLSDRIGLTGQTIYSATKSLSNNRYTNVTKYVCTGTDAVIDFTFSIPKFKILFTTLDENNKEGSHAIPFSSSSYNTSSFIWFDESQADIALDSNKVYEINYTVNPNATTDNFPFSFKYIMAAVNDTYSTKVCQEISPSKYSNYDEFYSTDYIEDGTTFLIGDRVKIRGTNYYKGVLDEKAFYIPASKVYLTDDERLKIDTLVNSSQSVRDEFFEFAKALSRFIYLNNLEDAINTIKGFSSKGISIPSWSVYDMSEYTDGTGVRFTFHNPTNKTIKYVNISFAGYNAVDDRVGKIISKRCIGPIEPDETASYDFEYAWFTDIIQYAKITSLSVQYKDGTTKVVSDPSSVVWSDDINNMFNSRLDKLKFELVDSDEEVITEEVVTE